MASVGSVHTVGNQMILGNAGGTANGGSNSGEFATVDISDPLTPKVQDIATGIGNYSVGFYGNFVTMQGGGGTDQIQVWDVSDPTDVVLKRTIDLSDIGNSTGFALYSAFQDKFFQGPMFRNYHKMSFDYDQASPTLANAGVKTADGPIDKTYEFVSVVGNLIIGAGGGNGDGLKIVPHQTGRDRTAPEVNFVSPAADATNQALTSRIGVTVTDTLDFTTVSTAHFQVNPVGGAPIDGVFTYSRNYLNFTPSQPLLADTTYQITIPSDGIEDLTGNGIESFTSYFSTGNQIIISNDPSLVITSPSDGATTAPSIDVNFSALNWFENGEYIQYFLDGGAGVAHTVNAPLSLTGLSAGAHTLRLAFYNADHSPAGISDEINFAVDPLANLMKHPLPLHRQVRHRSILVQRCSLMPQGARTPMQVQRH